MSEKTVLITGCSSGIGHATAERFIENDWTVYATARETDTLDSLWNLGCNIERVDVTRHEDIHKIITTITKETGRLDCLVNNAGYGQFGPMEDIPASALRQQFDVNVFGVHRLTREALPLLRESHGTIINMSSVAGQISFPGTGAYAASKAALEAMSDALRVELAEHDVDVVLIEPGPVETQFWETRTDSLEELSKTDAYEPIYEFHSGQSQTQDSFPPSSPEDVADKIYHAVIEAPQPRVPVGERTASAMWLDRLAPTRLRDWLYSRILSQK